MYLTKGVSEFLFIVNAQIYILKLSLLGNDVILLYK